MAFSASNKFNSLVRINCVCNSKEEAFAIPRKWKNSLLLFLPAPSEILDGIEMTDLLIWEIKPNFSSFGKSAQTI